MKNSKPLAAAGCAALIISLSAAIFSSAVAAPVTIGDQVVDSANAANLVSTNSGETEIFDKFKTGVADQSSAIGGSLLDGVRCVGLGGCSFTVGFGHDVTNQGGDDLIIAGLGFVNGGSENFDISINGVTKFELALVGTGVFLGVAPLKSLAIDLSDFGLGIGEAIRSLTITVAQGANSEEFTYFSSLNDENVLVNPIPGAIWLFGSALFAGGLFRRRAQKA